MIETIGGKKLEFINEMSKVYGDVVSAFIDGKRKAFIKPDQGWFGVFTFEKEPFCMGNGFDLDEAKLIVREWILEKWIY